MPDVHYGKGCTVGSVIAMKGAVSPAAVGVDIGCGMAAVKTSLTEGRLDGSLAGIRHDFERTIPVGFNAHRNAHGVGDDARALFEEWPRLDARVQDKLGKALDQVGTLGGGNHFIELCRDTGGGIWLMLHSGSRNIGKTLAELHISRARKLAHNAKLPDPDLAVYLAGTPEMAAYRRDLYWAQRYAAINRASMLRMLLRQLARRYPDATFAPPISCHHNYVSEETHFGEEAFVTRKGAISARAGEMGIIPGSMGTGSYIVRGLGNPDSFHSASHGAGRRMSRGAARRAFTVEDLVSQTAGVECRKDAGVLDEIPGAYKNISEVMAHQADLVEVVAHLKQLICVKG
jgi:tRNA-splicing ligase RtcB